MRNYYRIYNQTLKKIKLLSQKYGVIGMHLFALSEENIICRNFAPLYDIDEEAATGTSNGALACYLYHHQILQKPITPLPKVIP